ncbi:hypothetical protein AQPE_3603 [Aquipluma nitroreducens]|uniref:Uncharacterized protein n=1 Tax=Aquipluma nitroreducens TaxID=2010828 RepID=A0A5K7SCX4_9BACT|nr:hypothetical protein AQPE_3603 [Aquipluma nitroreducens]
MCCYLKTILYHAMQSRGSRGVGILKQVQDDRINDFLNNLNKIL